MDHWRMLIYDVHGTPEHLAKLYTILRNWHERNHENAWLLVCVQDGPTAEGGLTRMDLSQKFAPRVPVLAGCGTMHRRPHCLLSTPSQDPGSTLERAMRLLAEVADRANGREGREQPTTQMPRHARHRQEGSTGH